MTYLQVACVAVIVLSGALGAQYPYGAGSAGGSGVVPILTADQAWLGNGAFGLAVRSGLGGAPTVLVVSTGAASTPVAGAELLVGIAPPEILVLGAQVLGGTPGVPGAGTGFFPLPLPLPPSVPPAGLLAFAQVGIGDGGLATSNGLMIELTLPPLLAVGATASGFSFHYLVDPVARTLVASTSGPGTLSALAFGTGGDELFACSSTGLRHSPTAAGPPVWSTIASGFSSWRGIQFDHRRRLLYGVAAVAAGVDHLLPIDGDPASVGFGQPVALGTSFSFPQPNPFAPTRFALAASGDRAVAVGGTGELIVFDTDPASATWLQPLASSAVPGISLGGFASPRVQVAPGGRTALVSWNQSGFAGSLHLFRFDLTTLAWVDFNPPMPGIQPIGPQSVPAVPALGWSGAFALARDGFTAAVAPQAPAGSIGLIAFDPQNPAAFTYSSVASSLTQATAPVFALAPDHATLAAVDGLGTLTFFDLATGAVLGAPLALNPPSVVAVPALEFR